MDTGRVPGEVSKTAPMITVVKIARDSGGRKEVELSVEVSTRLLRVRVLPLSVRMIFCQVKDFPRILSNPSNSRCP